MFRACTSCDRTWATQGVFARDPETKVLGIVMDLHDPYRGLMLFNHACGTTLALAIESFRDRLPPLDVPLLHGTPGCGGHCMRMSDLTPCHQPCRNAPIRQLALSLIAEKAVSHDAAVE